MSWLYRFGWFVSVLLAVAGVALYLAVESDWAWWVGTAMASSVALMAAWRYERTRAERNGDVLAGGDDGPWAPP